MNKVGVFFFVFIVIMFLAAVVGGIAAIAGAPAVWLWGYFTGSGLVAAFTTLMGLAGMKQSIEGAK